MKTLFLLIKTMVYNLFKLDCILNEKILINKYEGDCLQSNESLVSGTCSENVIVSLTTYSKRIHDVYLTIESLGRQTVKADKIVLWLDEDEFNAKNLPISLKNQVDRGLEIKYVPNYRSYKKIIPALRIYPNSRIITVDDDILYPMDMIEQLTIKSFLYPESIIGHRGHSIQYDKKGKMLSYNKWRHEIQNESSENLFITTGGGTIFPPAVFASQYIDNELFLELTPYADDVWIKAISHLSKVNLLLVNDGRSFKKRFFYVQSSQDIGLFNQNVHLNMNDQQLNNIMKYYNINGFK